MKFLPVIILLLFNTLWAQSDYDGQLDLLAKDISEQIIDSDIQRIGVVDFTDLHGDVTELGKLMAEDLSVSMASSGKGFEVVDRSQIDFLIKEHQLGDKGLIDPKTATKLGRVAGVEALLAGKITPFGDQIKVNVKIVDTERGTVIGAARGQFALTKASGSLLATVVEDSDSLYESKKERRQRRWDNVNSILGAIDPALAPDGPSTISDKILYDSESLKIELLTWKMVGQELVCDVKFSSKRGGHEFLISKGSAIYTEAGTPYALSKVQTEMLYDTNTYSYRSWGYFCKFELNQTGDFQRIKIIADLKGDRPQSITKIKVGGYSLLPPRETTVRY